MSVDYKKRAKELLRVVLGTEQRMLKNTAYHRCGLALRPEEFDEVIQELFVEGFLTISVSVRGKDRLELMDVLPIR